MTHQLAYQIAKQRIADLQRTADQERLPRATETRRHPRAPKAGHPPPHPHLGRAHIHRLTANNPSHTTTATADWSISPGALHYGR